MSRGTSGGPGTAFVGRDEQLAALADAVARASAGTPGAVLLGADAGVGKTRLLTEVLTRATATGARAVVTHCVDLGDVGLPYLPFAEALGRLRDEPGLAHVVEEVLAERPALARLLPGAGPAPADDGAARLSLFDAIGAVLAGAGRPGAPLVLVVEDLHWADASSRDVLRFLISRLRGEHVLLVASYRTDELHRTHPLRPVLAELARHPRVERLELPAFTLSEMRTFAAAVNGSPLPERALRRVHERSEGNAYFAEELVEAGAESMALPGSLGDVLRSRVEQAAPEVQVLARAASVAGRRVREPLLRAVVTPRLGDAGAVDAALRAAVAGNVLHTEDGRLAFRHALLAEAVYADLLPSEQLGLHQAYLEAITAEPALGSAAELAHHARNANAWEVTVRASLDAATEAARVLAPVEEMRHLKTALHYWDALPGSADLGTDRAAVLERTVEAASRAGRLDFAVGLAREAVDLTQGDTVRNAWMRLVLARALLGIDRNGEAVDQASTALELLGPDGPALERAWAHAVLARSALIDDRDAVAHEAATAAVEVARSGGVPAAEADALATLAVLVVDDPTRAAELLEVARQRAHEAGDVLTEQRCAYNLATTAYYAGRLEAAERALTELLERSAATGLTWSEFGLSARFFSELVRYARGDLSAMSLPLDELPPVFAELFSAVGLYGATARGDDAVELGLRLAEPGGDAQVVLLAGGCTIDALTWQGRHDEAVELGSQLMEHLVARWDDYFLGGIWLAALSLGALADAAAVERLSGASTVEWQRRGAELLRLAEETAERGRPRGGRLGPEGRAWLARARAEAARLRQADDATALWAATVAEFDYGYRYEVARSRWRWAEAALAQGDRVTATEQAGTALAEAVAMGAGPLRTAVQTLARRARLDLPGARTAGEVLTAREQEVLTLVARGLTNRQIGEQLFISGKTVSVHVSNLLAKLGVSGRAEAVAAAHRRGLLDPAVVTADARG
ncbi:AAA family ATPase [Cellulomonas sp. APG4]|uniref:helix-turn-helix transcriptional regulator n=1 Tax=Cellulomonas sp. APG4 TaxID=1538656 RepID=UPI00137B32BF|nr:helix-turn-helix transcriptional regulator [Cellulomonas sp. APG4]NCT92173.1 AAA family ATPase [Cellulomonas sp. APG4]